MAATLAEVVADPQRARAMGVAGRARAIAEFGWDTVAARTLQVYGAVAR